MATTRFTKSLHQQATKHNKCQGWIHSERRQAYNEGLAVEPSGPSGVLGQSV